MVFMMKGRAKLEFCRTVPLVKEAVGLKGKTRMRLTEIGVDGRIVTQCIIRSVPAGTLANLPVAKAEEITLVIHEQRSHTPYTKRGYVAVEISTSKVQVKLYFSKGSLQHFLGMLAGSMVLPQWP